MITEGLENDNCYINPRAVTMTITLFFSGGETEQLLASRQPLLSLARLQPPSNIASRRLVLRSQSLSLYFAVIVGTIAMNSNL